MKTYENIISLSKEVWNDFSYWLSQPKDPRPIDIFFSNMPSILSIRYENGDVIIESDDIDEEEIIKALLNN